MGGLSSNLGAPVFDLPLFKDFLEEGRTWLTGMMIGALLSYIPQLASMKSTVHHCSKLFLQGPCIKQVDSS